MRSRLGAERKRLGGVAARRAYAEKKPADQSDKKRRDEGGRFRCDPHGVFPCLRRALRVITVAWRSTAVALATYSAFGAATALNVWPRADDAEGARRP
jgi:hypothetical protein